MFKIQEGLNRKLNPDWKNAGYNWRDATLVEATELFDHLPWKWWKASSSPIDWGQVNMEAVDLWHFILSEVMEQATDKTLDYVVKVMGLDDLEAERRISSVQTWVRELICVTMSPVFHGIPVSQYHDMHGDSHSMVEVFKGLTDSLQMSFDTLYKLYVGKAKLNELRWANGYGTRYIKNWLGQEDNQYLTELMETLDVNDPEFAEKILAGLEARYAEVLAAQEKAKAAEVEAYKERVMEVL